MKAYGEDYKKKYILLEVDNKANKEILIDDIETVLVGSKNYLVRNLEGTGFVEKINQISKTRKTESGALRRMDFIMAKSVILIVISI